jgi:hypothetical protein
MRLVGIRAISATPGFGVLAAGCSGVLVRGVDIRQIPTVQGHADDTTLETPPVRLVGRWAEGALTLTESPQSGSSATPIREPCPQPIGFEPSPDVLALQDRIVRDRAFVNGRIELLVSTPCEGRVGVLVAVADPETVHYLESRYPSVVVSGWLQPVSGW